MDDRPRHNSRSKRRERAARPLDRARLDELALAYVARFATSAGKLSAYLSRKLRERGWDGEGEPDVQAIVARMVDAGYVDDVAFAQAKRAGLLRRGYGARRIDQALRAAGIEEAVRDDVQASEGERRRAALALAKKRRFGPFGDAVGDPAKRQKQVAAMLRAGHPIDSARALIEAPSVEEAEQWAGEGEDDAGNAPW
ncbi:RecX family transcriptional regulator [Novosphingobium sp. ZN18A2]|uniref:regulatory protein RecX n=1 Tax=Novosphingobium sp. ZN18A2 TaxID=3079861 RepID=UPI0030CD6285